MSSDSATALALKEIEQHRAICVEQLRAMLLIEQKLGDMTEAERAAGCLEAAGVARDIAAAQLALLRLMSDTIERLTRAA